MVRYGFGFYWLFLFGLVVLIIRQSLWVDKVGLCVYSFCCFGLSVLYVMLQYRPHSLQDLHYHHDISNKIEALVKFIVRVFIPSSFNCQRLQTSSNDFPHLLFYGPSGSGRKTRIMCTLKQLFGASVEKVRGYSI